MLERFSATAGNKAKQAAYLLLSFLLAASFVLWGVGDAFYDARRNIIVAEIGDIEVDSRDFLRRYRLQTKEVQELLGTRLDVERGRKLGFVDSVMAEFVIRALFDNAAHGMDLQTSDKLARDRIFLTPEFHDEQGVFSELKFRELLRQSGYSEDSFVRALKEDLRRRQLTRTISAAPAAARTMLDPLILFRQEARTALTILITPENVATPPPPPESALRSWMEEHGGDFSHPEYRRITYVALNPRNLIDEIAVDEERIRELYQARKDSYITPERRDLDQMLLEDEASARKARARLDAGGDFRQTAREVAAMEEEDVDLGWNMRDELPSALAEAAFALEKGGVSAVVPSPFGWHIIRVKAIDPRLEIKLEEVRETLRAELAFIEAADAAYELLARFEDAFAAGQSLEQAGHDINLETKSVTLDAMGKSPDGKPLQGIPQGERFLKSVFATAPGDVGDVVESEDYGFFALRVDSVEAARLKSFSEARDDVLAAWRLERAKERTLTRALELTKALNAGGDLKTLATARKLKIVELEPFTRSNFLDKKVPGALVEALFQANKGEAVSATLKEGSMVGVLTDIIAPSLDDPQAMEPIRERMPESIGDDLVVQYGHYLQNLYPVTVYDRALDELVL